MKMWCVLKSVEHTDFYDGGDDGVDVIAVCASWDAAYKVMCDDSDAIKITDDDTVDMNIDKCEIGRWVNVDGKGLEHDCDYKWWIKEMEVVE